MPFYLLSDQLEVKSSALVIRRKQVKHAIEPHKIVSLHQTVSAQHSLKICLHLSAPPCT